MVVSVVAGFRYMSISILDGCLMIVKSRKFIVLFCSCVCGCELQGGVYAVNVV
jgi:hypothetical protein